MHFKLRINAMVSVPQKLSNAGCVCVSVCVVTCIPAHKVQDDCSVLRLCTTIQPLDTVTVHGSLRILTLEVKFLISLLGRFAVATLSAKEKKDVHQPLIPNSLHNCFSWIINRLLGRAGLDYCDGRDVEGYSE